MTRLLRYSAVSLALTYVALGIAALVLFAAPLWYVARMNLITPPQPSELAYGLALALTWGSALLALVLLRIPGAAGLPSFLRPHAESA